MLKKVLIGTSFLVVGLYSTSVLSAGQMVKFSMVDANGDGRVTAAEWEKLTRGQSDALKYSDLDIDKNGGVTESEFNIAMQMNSKLKKY